MNVLVTGSGGYLGARLVQYLSCGHKLKISLSPSSALVKEVLGESISSINLNWDDRKSISNAMNGIDAVIHAYGLNASACEMSASNALAMNAINTASLLEAAIENNVKKFIYLSSAHVYGSLNGEISEDSPLNAVHPYGFSKRAGEDVVKFVAGKNKKINFQILRLANVFGPPFPGNQTCWTLLVNDLCHQAVYSDCLILKSNGLQSRNFLTMFDFLRAVEHLLEGPFDVGVYNLGSEISMTVIEMANLIAQRLFSITGRNIKVYKNEEDKSEGSFIFYDCSKLKGTNFHFTNNFIDEVDGTLKYLMLEGGVGILNKTKYAILGAGIAGLGASLGLRERGEDSIIFEKHSSSGGLLDNLVIEGFVFDKAVHLSFATESKVREVFDKTPYITHPSDSYCFDDGLWLKHPIQNNLFKLAPEEKVGLIESFVSRPDELPLENYKDWLYHQYGVEISERYPIRYTRKYWCSEPEDLSIGWIGNRMRRSKLSEVLYGAFSGDTPNHYYTQEMRYPLFGGYKSFINPLIQVSNIKNDANLIEIDVRKKVLYFENSEPYSYDYLISTLPLPYIIKTIKSAPEDIVAASERLKVTSMDLISVGLNKKLIDKLWFYIYDEDIYASRAYSPSVKSPNNCPPACSSIQFEVYSLDGKGRRSDDDLIQNAIYALGKLGIACQEDILFIKVDHVTHANVLFYSGMEKDREIVLDYLKGMDIKSCGRFGEWDYLWSNQSLLSGYNVATEI